MVASPSPQTQQTFIEPPAVTKMEMSPEKSMTLRSSCKQRIRLDAENFINNVSPSHSNIHLEAAEQPSSVTQKPNEEPTQVKPNVVHQ